MRQQSVGVITILFNSFTPDWGKGSMINVVIRRVTWNVCEKTED